MVETASQHAVARNPDVKHERSDVNVRGILWFTAGFIVLAALVHFLLMGQFVILRRAQDRIKESQFPIGTVLHDRLPPEPRLESLIHLAGAQTADVERVLAEKEGLLSRYGETDEKGFVHIPIKQAMKLVLGKLKSTAGKDAGTHKEGSR